MLVPPCSFTNPSLSIEVFDFLCFTVDAHITIRTLTVNIEWCLTKSCCTLKTTVYLSTHAEMRRVYYPSVDMLRSFILASVYRTPVSYRTVGYWAQWTLTQAASGVEGNERQSGSLQRWNGDTWQYMDSDRTEQNRTEQNSDDKDGIKHLTTLT